MQTRKLTRNQDGGTICDIACNSIWKQTFLLGVIYMLFRNRKVKYLWILCIWSSSLVISAPAMNYLRSPFATKAIVDILYDTRFHPLSSLQASAWPLIKRRHIRRGWVVDELQLTSVDCGITMKTYTRFFNKGSSKKIILSVSLLWPLWLLLYSILCLSTHWIISE